MFGIYNVKWPWLQQLTYDLNMNLSVFQHIADRYLFCESLGKENLKLFLLFIKGFII